MTEDLIDSNLARLIAAHPALFRSGAPVVPSYLPAGLYSLVDQLCLDIEGTLGEEGCAAYEVTQIKQKFGALRFYWATRDGASDIHVDFIGAEGLKSVVKEIGPDDVVLKLVRGLGKVCITSGGPE